jgi:cell division protease FtsH
MNDEDLDKKANEKNLKMMILSATLLFVLFGYTLYKSDHNLNVTNSYYYGVIFLIFLVVFAFFLRIFRDKVRKFVLSKQSSKFENELKKVEPTVNKMKEVKNNMDSLNPSITASTSNLTFDDVAGIDSVKEELYEIIDFLNFPKKYLSYGIKLPKGVLLVGPPGVGKTLVAKAVAGEAEVPFFYKSGANFVHIYVGMGAKRVQELFLEARKNAPSIIFIDEIDAIGKSRDFGSSNEEREATLNELLTQMDGFEDDNGVIVIAATNKIEVLDEALLRAGRFDRRVFLNLPNINDRKKILNLYLKGKKYDFDVDKLVLDTSGFSSSALATLINEALLNMIKNGSDIIIQEDIDIAKDKIQFGKKERVIDEAQKAILAIYQAGKSYITDESFKLFEEGIKHKDTLYPSKSQLLNTIKYYLAGSMTIEVIKGEPYAIFPNDYKEAMKIADDMVNLYNMAKDKDSIIDDIKSELKTTILENKEKILSLQQELIEFESCTP